MKRVIALGFFDGVHLGHGALLQKAGELAPRLGAVPSVLTFDVPPQEEITHRAVRVITGVEDRKLLIRREYGIEDVLVLTFDRKLMRTEPEAFFRLLRKRYEAVGLVCGADFRFGKDAAGDVELLRRLCEEKGVALEVADEVVLHGQRVSSSAIRGLLENGEVEEAARLLGHEHIMTGAASGERAEGFPSVRVIPDSGVLLPLAGLYDTRLVAPDGRASAAVTGVGENGTVSRIVGGGLDPIPPRLTVEFLRYLGE